MKKFLDVLSTFTGAMVAAAFVCALWSAPTYAICQSCPGMGSLQGDCYTITDPCHYLEATMGACVRVPVYDDTTHQLLYYKCDGMGSQPGPECKSQPGSCGGNGNGPGGGGSTADGGECTISGGACPPECMMCTQSTDIWT